MRYALINPYSRVAGVQDLESPELWQYPEDFHLVPADDFAPAPGTDVWDYRYSDGKFIYIAPPPEPLSLAEAASLMMQAAQGGSISDAKAALMAPYLPVWDATVDYPEGSLAVRSGRVCRKTSIGWRELG